MHTWSCLGLTLLLSGGSKTITVTNNSPVHSTGKLEGAGLASGCLLVFCTQPLGGKWEGEERGGGGSSPVFVIAAAIWDMVVALVLSTAAKETINGEGAAKGGMGNNGSLMCCMHCQTGICVGFISTQEAGCSTWIPWC